MKKVISCLCAGLMVVFCMAADLYHPPSSDVMASSYGDRTGTTITNIVGQVGSRYVNLILDGGSWTIGNNVTFPSNICVTVTPGSYLNISNGYVVTFQTNDLIAGHWPVFSGSGTATGTANMVFRPSEWGSDTQYNIGSGDVSSNTFVHVNDLSRRMITAFPNLQTNTPTPVTLSLSNILATANNAAGQSATNFGSVSGSNATFTVISGGTLQLNSTLITSNQDFSIAVLGYPKIVLTTNMLSGSNAGGSLINLTSFTNAFDNNFNTVTSTGTIVASSHPYQAYIVDLQTNYTGFFCLTIVLTPNDGYPMSLGIGGGITTVMENSIIQGPGGTPAYYSDFYSTKGVSFTNTILKSFTGSKIGLGLYTSGSSGTYYIKDFSVWGLTNGFRSFTGTP